MSIRLLMENCFWKDFYFSSKYVTLQDKIILRRTSKFFLNLFFEYDSWFLHFVIKSSLSYLKTKLFHPLAETLFNCCQIMIDFNISHHHLGLISFFLAKMCPLADKLDRIFHLIRTWNVEVDGNLFERLMESGFVWNNAPRTADRLRPSLLIWKRFSKNCFDWCPLFVSREEQSLRWQLAESLFFPPSIYEPSFRLLTLPIDFVQNRLKGIQNLLKERFLDSNQIDLDHILTISEIDFQNLIHHRISLSSIPEFFDETILFPDVSFFAQAKNLAPDTKIINLCNGLDFLCKRLQHDKPQYLHFTSLIRRTFRNYDQDWIEVVNRCKPSTRSIIFSNLSLFVRIHFADFLDIIQNNLYFMTDCDLISLFHFLTNEKSLIKCTKFLIYCFRIKSPRYLCHKKMTIQTTFDEMNVYLDTPILSRLMICTKRQLAIIIQFVFLAFVLKNFNNSVYVTSLTEKGFRFLKIIKLVKIGVDLETLLTLYQTNHEWFCLYSLILKEQLIK